MDFIKKPIHILEKREPLFAITLAAVILGANAPISKWTLQFISVESLAFLRFFLAFIIFYLIFRPSLYIKKIDIPKIFLCGFVGISIHIPLFYTGITLTGAINAAIIASSIPILSLLFSKLFLKERISRKFFVGGFIGLFGVIFTIAEPIFESGLSANLLGNFLLLSSAITFIIFEILSKKISTEYSIKTRTIYFYLIGSLSFLPFFVSDVSEKGLYFLNFKPIIGITFIVILASLTAIPLWQWGISKLEVSRIGFFLYLDPVVAFIVAFFLLGELITPPMLIGAVFIFIGLYIAENTIHLPHFHLYHAHLRHKRS